MKARNIYRGIVFLAACNVHALCHAQGAAPPAPDNSGLDDIIVTAQKRSEDLQSIPIAVTALNDKALQNAGITSTTGLSALTPSLTVNQAAGAFLANFIRGVGSRQAPPGLEPSIAVYIDDRYESQPSGTVVQFLDVERVEVVKGPQGVLFGRNATGGALRVITNAPQDDFSAHVRVGYGNYDAREARATVNLPLSDGFAARISGLSVQHDGYARNLVPTGRRELDDRDVQQIRGRFKWEASPAVTANLSLEYWDQNDSAGQDNVLLPPFNLNSAAAAGALYGTRRGVAATALTGGIEQHQFSSEFRIDASLGAVDLASISTYSNLISHFANDVDSTSAVLTDAIDYSISSKALTQEFQLVSDASGPFNWLAGVYYIHADQTVYARARVPIEVSTGGIQHVLTSSVAGFGQGSYKIGGGWSITLGGRYSYERKKLGVTLDAGVPNAVNAALLPFRRKTTFKKFTPKAVLQWDYGDDGMVYASYSRGIKGGGFSFPAVGQPVLRPEVLDSYEIGWKADLFDKAVKISTAAYYYDYKDLQVTRTVTLPNGLFSINTDNAASSVVKGVEGDLRWRVARGFTLSTGASYVHGRYKDYLAAARTFNIDTATPGTGLGTTSIPYNADGKNLLRIPEFSGYVSGEYSIEMDGGTLSGSATYSYKSSSLFDFIATPRMSSLRQDGYGLLSARLSYTFTKPNLRVSLYGNNLTDSVYLDDASVSGQGPKGSYGDPRTYGIQLDLNF
jgi:iron complex outermembrane receptor protein